MATALDTIPDFAGLTVVIVGDLVADQFLSGSIARVSREAPVFILRHEETTTLPGGAANAAANVAALGGEPILIGVTGDDEAGALLRASLEKARVKTDLVIAEAAARTTTKVRVLAGQSYAAKQQVIRIDYEASPAVLPETLERIRDRIDTAAAAADAVIVSDYGYGVADSSVTAAAREIAARYKIPLVVDSRSRLAELGGATSATPNLDEVEAILGPRFTDADCERLRRDLDLRALLVTCGNRGMMLFDGGAEPKRLPAVGPLTPVDVTGAGDTVIAAYTLGIASGLGFFEAAQLANHAGAVVVMKKGTAVATRAEIADLARLPGGRTIEKQIV